MKIFLTTFFISLFCIQLSSAQEMEFEELSTVTYTQLRSTYANDIGHIYGTSIEDNLFRSLDNGQTWEALVDFPSFVVNFEMFFLDDGRPVFSKIDSHTIFNVGDTIPSVKSLVVEHDNEFVNVLPDSLVDYWAGSDLYLHENSIYIYNDGYLYRSEDYGLSFSKIKDASPNIDNKRLFVTDKNIMILKSELLAGNIDPISYMDIYDKDFNFKFKSYQNFKTPIFASDNGALVFIDNQAKKIKYSKSNASNLLIKSIDPSHEVWWAAIIGSYFYYQSNSSIYRIEMNVNFENNPIELFKEFGTGRIQFSRNIILHHSVYNDITLFNPERQEESFIGRLNFKDNRVDFLHVPEQGSIRALCTRSLYKTNDDTESWASELDLIEYYTNIFFSDNGSIIHSNRDSIYEYTLSGETKVWDIYNVFTSQQTWPSDDFLAFSFNDDQYRIVLADGDSMVYVSKEMEPFYGVSMGQEIEVRSQIETAGAQLIDDEILIYHRPGNSFMPLIRINVVDSIKVNLDSRINLISQTRREFLGMTMSDSGELFAHPNGFGIAIDDSVSRISYYSPSKDIDMEPIGFGPPGEIYYSDKLSMSLVLTDDHKLFIRKALGDDFSEVTVLNKDYDRINCVAFDKEGRLLMSVDNFVGRIIRLDFNKLTSTNELEYEYGEISLFPNPVENNVNVILPEQISGSYLIHNVEGQFIETSKFSGNQLNLNTSSFESGMYLVTIVENGKIITTSKFVKL